MEENDKEKNNSIYNYFHFHGDVNDTNINAGTGNTINNEKQKGLENEILFDAGGRLRQVRDEVRLKTSEFVELLGLQSEKQYKAMESQSEEVPLAVLKKVSEKIGTSIEWLKHGIEPRYEIEFLYLKTFEEVPQGFFSTHKPQDFILTLELKNLHVGLVARTGTFCFEIYETEISLKFWEWQDEHWAIPLFYKFLKALSDSRKDVYGVILTQQDDKKLYSGAVHFLHTQGQYNMNILYDLIDLDETRLKARPYSNMYSGDWMSRVHKEFKWYLERDEKRKKEGDK